MDFNEDDVQYEDFGDDGGSGSDILSSIFQSAGQIGSSYFASQTPQVVPTAPFGAVNPATGRPYAMAGAAPTSPLLMLGIIGVVGYFAYQALSK